MSETVDLITAKMQGFFVAYFGNHILVKCDGKELVFESPDAFLSWTVEKLKNDGWPLSDWSWK